jgi:hypothetical protein
LADLLLAGNSVRSTMTRRQLRDAVRAELALLDGVFLTDDNIDSYLLQYQQILARETEWYRFQDRLSTSGNVRAYDMPSDCISLSYVAYDTWVLPHVALHDLVQRYPLALTDTYTGQPWAYTVDGASRLLLFPMPAVSSGAVLTVIYSALPPEPVSDDDLFWWPPYADVAAIQYGAKRGAIKDLGREGQRRYAVIAAEYEREQMQVIDRIRSRAEEDALVWGGRRRGVIDPLMSGWYPQRVPMP